MGIVSSTAKGAGAGLLRVPHGCFTLDPSGKVLTSTLPQSFPADIIRKIGRSVLATFQSAHTAHMAFTEIQVLYPALRITARELKGGAIVFLAPQVLAPPSSGL